MNRVPIDVASLAELASAAFHAQTTGPHDIVLPAGRYGRSPMFNVDATELEEPHRDLFDSYLRKLEQEHPAVERAVFRDAMVCGQGAVIVGGRHLLRESAIEFLAHQRLPDGLEIAADGSYALGAAPVRRIARPTLLLQRPWFANYGHWLVDGAAVLALLSRLAMPKGWQIVVGAQPGNTMRDVVFETLSMLAPGVGVVERPQGETWEFEELHYVSPIHVPPLYKHPEAIACLRAAATRDNVAGGSRTARFFVCRGDSRSRLLQNEEEVLRLLASRGFSALPNEPRSVREQARLFRSAQIVVGVKGAALTNMMFATSGAHLVALSPADFPDPFFWDLVSHSGVNYSELFGMLTSGDLPQSHNSFRIDPRKLSAILDEIETRLPS